MYNNNEKHYHHRIRNHFAQTMLKAYGFRCGLLPLCDVACLCRCAMDHDIFAFSDEEDTGGVDGGLAGHAPAPHSGDTLSVGGAAEGEVVRPVATRPPRNPVWSRGPSRRAGRLPLTWLLPLTLQLR